MLESPSPLKSWSLEYRNCIMEGDFTLNLVGDLDEHLFYSCLLFVSVRSQSHAYLLHEVLGWQRDILEPVQQGSLAGQHIVLQVQLTYPQRYRIQPKQRHELLLLSRRRIREGEQGYECFCAP